MIAILLSYISVRKTRKTKKKTPNDEQKKQTRARLKLEKNPKNIVKPFRELCENFIELKNHSQDLERKKTHSKKNNARKTSRLIIWHHQSTLGRNAIQM